MYLLAFSGSCDPRYTVDLHAANYIRNGLGTLLVEPEVVGLVADDCICRQSSMDCVPNLGSRAG